ncbi:MAG: DoxX protein [Psychroserpens sp.]|uniref:DoxX protein n=1 Tax=Psychroserpens sp. TaxID=2020870 RepID=UPI003002F2B2
MKTTQNILRFFFGIFLLTFGLNGFLHFMPIPEMTPEGGEFIGALIKAGYIMPIVAILQIVIGLLLIVNKYVPLALVVIFPILLNAFLLHLVLDIGGISGALIAITLNVFLCISYKENYMTLLKSKSRVEI